MSEIHPERREPANDPPPAATRAIDDALYLHSRVDQSEAAPPFYSDLQQHLRDCRIETGAMTVQWLYPKPQVFRDEPVRLELTPEQEVEVRAIARRWAPDADA